MMVQGFIWYLLLDSQFYILYRVSSITNRRKPWSRSSRLVNVLGSGRLGKYTTSGSQWTNYFAWRVDRLESYLTTIKFCKECLQLVIVMYCDPNYNWTLHYVRVSTRTSSVKVGSDISPGFGCTKRSIGIVFSFFISSVLAASLFQYKSSNEFHVPNLKPISTSSSILFSSG